MAFQRDVTKVAWGWAWSRPVLDAKTRCRLNLAMLRAPGRFDELGIYVMGAFAAGDGSRDPGGLAAHDRVLRKTAGRQSFLAAHRARAAEGALG
jgi:4-carboxymuconolactone decarboxylase